jgi:hypothetical protein
MNSGIFRLVQNAKGKFPRKATLTQFGEWMYSIVELHEICQVGTEFFHAGGRRDGHTKRQTR